MYFIILLVILLWFRYEYGKALRGNDFWIKNRGYRKGQVLLFGPNYYEVVKVTNTRAKLRPYN